MKTRLVRKFFSVATLIVFGYFALPAQAAIVTVNFTAEITASSTATLLGLSGGEAVTGQFTYDPNAPLISTTATQALYGPDGVPTFDYSIAGGPSASGFPGGIRSIQIFNSSFDGANFFRAVSGDTINGLSPVEVVYIAQNNAGGVLPDLNIPSTLNLTDWPDSLVQFKFLDGTGTASFMFADVASVNAVPLPAAVYLFGSGLLGLVGMARKKAG